MPLQLILARSAGQGLRPRVCGLPSYHTCVPAYCLQGDPAVEAVVLGVRQGNDPPIPPEHVLGLANASAVDTWLLQHPETVRAVSRGTQVSWRPVCKCCPGRCR